jgi:simple sugar transport system substrate-binding protein
MTARNGRLRSRWAARLAGTAAAGLVATLALTGCSDDGDGGGGGGGDYTFAVISHASSGDKFWDVVKNGAEQAGKDLGVEVKYQGDGDPQRQSQLIDQAVSDKVDGLVVSMANPDALQESIKKAVDADIPVITINSGGDRSAEFGAITHIGQTESVAGEAAGKRLAEGGAKHVVCVIHEAGNVGLEERCAGAGKALQAAGATIENLQVNVTDLADATAKMAAKLQSDKTVDGLLTLNNGVATAAVSSVQQAGSQAKIGTFDLDSDVISGISDGKISFAVDQQQYLQGYLPISFLLLYKTNGNIVGGGQPVLSGPGFVDKDNADTVAKYAKNGTR